MIRVVFQILRNQIASSLVPSGVAAGWGRAQLCCPVIPPADPVLSRVSPASLPAPTCSQAPLPGFCFDCSGLCIMVD